MIISCKDTDNPPYINRLVESFLVVREVVDIFWHNKSEFFGLDCTYSVCKLNTIEYITYFNMWYVKNKHFLRILCNINQRRGSIHLIMVQILKSFNMGGWLGPKDPPLQYDNKLLILSAYNWCVIIFPLIMAPPHFWDLEAC